MQSHSFKINLFRLELIRSSLHYACTTLKYRLIGSLVYIVCAFPNIIFTWFIGGFALDRGTEPENIKTPEEGGTRKDYEEILDVLKNHVSVTWDGGREMKKMITDSEEPEIKVPENLSVEDEKSKLRSTIWNLKLENYAMNLELLREIKEALLSLMLNNISKIVKGKLASKAYFKEKEKSGRCYLVNGSSRRTD